MVKLSLLYSFPKDDHISFKHYIFGQNNKISNNKWLNNKIKQEFLQSKLGEIPCGRRGSVGLQSWTLKTTFVWKEKYVWNSTFKKIRSTYYGSIVEILKIVIALWNYIIFKTPISLVKMKTIYKYHVSILGCLHLCRNYTDFFKKKAMTFLNQSLSKIK
jgi:hypothetical protein